MEEVKKDTIKYAHFRLDCGGAITAAIDLDREKDLVKITYAFCSPKQKQFIKKEGRKTCIERFVRGQYITYPLDNILRSNKNKKLHSLLKSFALHHALSQFLFLFKSEVFKFDCAWVDSYTNIPVKEQIYIAPFSLSTK